MERQTVNGVDAYRPDRADIEGLQVGDNAVDVFGEWSEVTEIFARGDNWKDGGAYVCFYTRMKLGGTVSGDMREGETIFTIPLGRVVDRIDSIQWETAVTQ